VINYEGGVSWCNDDKKVTIMIKNILNSIKLKKRDKKQEVDEVYSFFCL
jgi:hypothetical protein